MVRSECAHVRGFGYSISHSRKAREGKGRAHLVAGGAPEEELAGRRRLSPVVAAWKEGRERGKREEKNAARREAHEKPTNGVPAGADGRKEGGRRGRGIPAVGSWGFVGE
jgi:hypothetical protein